MTDTLYRAVKFTERQPADKKVNGGTLSANGPYFCNMLDNVVGLCQWRGGKFYTIEEVDGKIVENETNEVVEWLEPYTPSPVSGSLEDAANKSFEVESKGSYFENHIYYELASENITPEQRMNICRSLYRSGYVAGAAYGKGGEEMLKELKDIKETFQWTWDNMETPHTSDHFNIPANGIAALDRIIESNQNK